MKITVFTRGSSLILSYTPSAYTMTGMTAANNTVLAVTMPVAYLSLIHI